MFAETAYTRHHRANGFYTRGALRTIVALFVEATGYEFMNSRCIHQSNQAHLENKTSEFEASLTSADYHFLV